MQTLVILHNEYYTAEGDEDEETRVRQTPLASLTNWLGPIDGPKILDAYFEKFNALMVARHYMRKHLSIVVVPDVSGYLRDCIATPG